MREEYYAQQVNSAGKGKKVEDREEGKGVREAPGEGECGETEQDEMRGDVVGGGLGKRGEKGKRGGGREKERKGVERLESDGVRDDSFTCSKKKKKKEKKSTC